MSFAYALEHCLPSFSVHIRCILHYLIPIRLLKGHYPSSTLLQKFSIHQIYSNLVECIKVGNIRAFLRCLGEQSKLFLSLGTYVSLEKCNFVVYRNLFCHVFKFNLSNTKISYQLLQIGLHLSSNCKQSTSDLEMILAGLISKHLVKGYLSHDKEFLVLSQVNPFPTEFFIC